jgi:hypothetical protein
MGAHARLQECRLTMSDLSSVITRNRGAERFGVCTGTASGRSKHGPGRLMIAHP